MITGNIGLALGTRTDHDIESPHHFFDAFKIAHLEQSAIPFFHHDHHIGIIGEPILTGTETTLDLFFRSRSCGKVMRRMNVMIEDLSMAAGAGFGAGKLLPANLPKVPSR